MMGRMLTFLAGAVGFWTLVVLPASWWRDGNTIILGAVAAGICLIPALATLAWALWAASRSPMHRLVAGLLGMMVRMGMVLGCGLACFLLLPGFRTPAFWIWLLVFYVFTLALEMVLVFGMGPAARNLAD
jgi:hypothetical protein